MECHGNLRDQLNTVPSSFIMEEMPIITSSPIEGKLIESSPFTQNNNVNNRDFLTWSALLDDYRRTPKTKTRKKSTVIEQSPSASSSSSSFKTIAEHEMRVLLTPNRKIHVLSSSARKIRPQLHTPKKSNNEKISQSIGVLKEKIRSNEVMTIEEIDAYERILKRHIEQQQKAEEDEVRKLNSSYCGLFNYHITLSFILWIAVFHRSARCDKVITCALQDFQNKE